MAIAGKNEGVLKMSDRTWNDQIKQLGDVSRNVIDSFASVIGRSRARTGVIVAFSFDQGTFEGTVRAKLHYGFEIKTVTVRELIEGSGRAH